MAGIQQSTAHLIGLADAWLAHLAVRQAARIDRALLAQRLPAGLFSIGTGATRNTPKILTSGGQSGSSNSRNPGAVSALRRNGRNADQGQRIWR